MGKRKFEIARAFRGVREIAEAGYTGRSSDQIALNLIAELIAQETKFLAGLYTFSQHRKLEPTPNAKHRPNDGRRLFVGVNRLDERSVDVDLVERERPQVRRRCVTGPEIGHCNA